MPNQKMLEAQLGNILFPGLLDDKPNPMLIDNSELCRMQLVLQMNKGIRPSFDFCLDSLLVLVRGVPYPAILSGGKSKAIDKVAHYFISAAVDGAQDTADFNLILRAIKGRKKESGQKSLRHPNWRWIKYAKDEMIAAVADKKVSVVKAENFKSVLAARANQANEHCE